MIAVCMLGWNHAWYTKRAIQSIRRNSGSEDIGLFLVDNGSTDETQEVMRAAQPKAFIRNHENLGISAGWNQAIEAALSYNYTEFTVLANNDIMVGPGWLEPVRRELSKNDSRYFLPNGAVTDEETFEIEVERRRPGLLGKTTPGRAGWCMFFRAQTARLFHPVPSELRLWYGDDYIHWKLASFGYRCEVLLDSFVLHYGSRSIGDYPGKCEQIARDLEAYKKITGGSP